MKPDDWVDVEQIDDPMDVKPIDWDQPLNIPDVSVTKPDDWDDDMDGTWEPPRIRNPKYKGEWKPKQINNPNYKGPWTAPVIDNPNYTESPDLYQQSPIGGVGFDIWQVLNSNIAQFCTYRNFR